MRNIALTLVQITIGVCLYRWYTGVYNVQEFAEAAAYPVLYQLINLDWSLEQDNRLMLAQRRFLIAVMIIGNVYYLLAILNKMLL